MVGLGGACWQIEVLKKQTISKCGDKTLIEKFIFFVTNEIMHPFQ